nr:hypothetical protein SPBC337.02c - fission yeast (Schizosaccharomyces pombe) [Schizosaccharomyces pombe]
MKYEIECNERLQGWKKLAIEREISEEQSGEVQFPRWIDEWANTKLGGIFERIFSKMDSMQNDMNSRFDAMQNEMTSMKGEMAEMKVEMVEMKRETIRLNTRIDLLEQKTEARFQSIEQRFNSIDQRFDSMEQRLDSMDQKMETIDARSCRSIMLTRKLENATRSDQGYLASPVPFLNGNEPVSSGLPPIERVEDIDELSKEQCVQYLKGYGITFSPAETIKLKKRLRDTVGLWSKASTEYEFHQFH